MIVFNNKIAVSALLSQIEAVIDGVFSQGPYETNGIVAHLRRIGHTDFRIDQNEVSLSIPLHIDLKREAALFTVEGHGGIQLNISLHYDISKSMILSVKSDITGHDWIEKPVIDFGAIDLPVTSVVDLMLKHYESVITAQIDEKANQNVNLKQIAKKAVANLNEKLAETNFHGVKGYVALKEIMLLKPYTADGYIYLKGAISADISITDNDINIEEDNLTFRWTEQIAPDNIILVNVDVSHHALEDIITSFVNEQEYGGNKIVANNCKVSQEGETTRIGINILKPLSGKAMVIAQPYYNEFEGKLYAKNTDIKIVPDSFLYKLTAPLVNKYIETMVDDVLPYDIQSLLKEKWGEILQMVRGGKGIDLKLNGSPVQLSELKFTEDGIFGKLKAVNLVVDATMNDGSIFA